MIMNGNITNGKVNDAIKTEWRNLIGENDVNNFELFQNLDKKFRSNGQTQKQPGIYRIYPVLYCY